MAPHDSPIERRQKAEVPDSAGGRFRSKGDGKKNEFDVHDAEKFNLQTIKDLRFDLSSSVVADLTVAENAVWDLNQRKTGVPKSVYAEAFLNIEALASVRMDGKPPAADQIFIEAAQASFSRGVDTDYLVRFRRDRASLEYALEQAETDCTLQTYRNIHAKVLPPKHAETGGLLRDEMRQIGGSRYHMFGGAYKMPSPEDVEPLLQDLADFMNNEEIPVIEQAAIAHAQLVNIHPFARGNGKMARMAVNTALRYRGLAPYYLLPFTPVVVTSSHDYIAGINGCMFDGSETRAETNSHMNAWLNYFATCCLKAVEISAGFMNGCEAAYGKYIESCHLRKGSVGLSLLEILPAMPVFTVQQVTERLGCSFKRASEAAKQLDDAGVLELASETKRNRIYVCADILDCYLDIDALR